MTSTCAQCGSESGENVKLYPMELCWACSERLGKEERDALRYRWIRRHGAWETEAFLNGLSPEEYDVALDKCMAQVP